MIIDTQYELILKTLEPFNPVKVGIFGSYARNEQTENSDLDILISFKETISLLDLVGLEQDLSDLLGIKVDLVTERSVNPRLKKYIYQDLKVIFE